MLKKNSFKVNYDSLTLDLICVLYALKRYPNQTLGLQSVVIYSVLIVSRNQ